jgi:hypothetical protein
MSIAKLDELRSLVAKLQADREAHVDAIAQIDDAFAALGLHATQPKKRGRPASVSSKPMK